MFYLSRGVLIGADAGGFATHYGSNVDFYLMTGEWSVLNPDVSVGLVESKKTNNTVFINNLNKEELLNVLVNNGREQINGFSQPKKITII